MHVFMLVDYFKQGKRSDKYGKKTFYIKPFARNYKI